MDRKKWSIAEAKQQFSEVVRRSEVEPQLIYRRNRLVAAIVQVDDPAEIPARSETSSLARYIRETRELVREHGFVLPRANRRTRRNDFVKVLDELADRHECPE